MLCKKQNKKHKKFNEIKFQIGGHLDIHVVLFPLITKVISKCILSHQFIFLL